jgi:hypothetical protein
VLDPELHEVIRIEANYFERNAARMRLAQGQQHIFVGSGVIKRVAKPSLLPGPNSQACFGQYAEPTPSSPTLL